jgi:hypothetical protein
MSTWEKQVEELAERLIESCYGTIWYDYKEKIKVPEIQEFVEAIRQATVEVIGRYEGGLPIDDFNRTSQQLAGYYIRINTRDDMRDELRTAIGASREEEKSE